MGLDGRAGLPKTLRERRRRNLADFQSHPTAMRSSPFPTSSSIATHRIRLSPMSGAAGRILHLRAVAVGLANLVSNRLRRISLAVHFLRFKSDGLTQVTDGSVSVGK